MEKVMNREDQKRAPIYEALEKFRKQRVVPFDVPGHKRGRGNPELVELLGEKCVGIDVNSMKPLDNLCHPVSVIRDAEELAADAFHAEHAFLMVGGTTSAVQSMILSVCKRGDKIILPRNVHKSAINALVLCGAIPVYVNPEVNPKLGISLGMEVPCVEQAIKENPDAVAVLVNNPTYYGIWFVDAMDNPEKYVGKTVRFKGRVMKPRGMGSKFFVPGRVAMTCCADDTSFLGYVCRSAYAPKLNAGDWVKIRAKVRYANLSVYGGEGPVLEAENIEPAEPIEELVYFN